MFNLPLCNSRRLIELVMTWPPLSIENQIISVFFLQTLTYSFGLGSTFERKGSS